MSAPGPFTGRCLCETVCFEVDAPTRWCFHCHCTLCRRAHGAAYVTWFGVPKSQLRVVSGENAIRWRESSSHGRRAYCGGCGSQLFFESGKWPGQIDVVRALVDGPIDREPAGHVFFDRRVDWVAVDDHLECHPQEYGSGANKDA